MFCFRKLNVTSCRVAAYMVEVQLWDRMGGKLSKEQNQLQYLKIHCMESEQLAKQKMIAATKIVPERQYPEY